MKINIIAWAGGNVLRNPDEAGDAAQQLFAGLRT